MATKYIIQHDSSYLFIEDLAKKMNTSIKEDNAEYCIDLPDQFGTGYFKCYLFDHGVSVILADAIFTENLGLSFTREHINPLKILFNLESSVLYQVSDNKKERKEIKKMQSVMVSQATNKVHTLYFRAKEATNIFIIQIDRKKFEPKIEQFVKEMNEELETLFRDLNGINHFYYQDFFNLDISELIEQYTSCDLEDFMKSVFLEGKVYEIITLFLAKYTDNLNEPDNRQLLRKSTVNKIDKAVEIIHDQLDERITVNALAKRVGLNQNTLQSGFKKLYKSSVNEYIRNTKIEKAKELLETSDMNITEITYKIGINSRSYFSKLFKARYGITPKQYIEQVRKESKVSA